MIQEHIKAYREGSASKRELCTFLQSSYTIEPNGSFLLKNRRLRR